MDGFSVVDANGNRKLTSLGTGALVIDPVTPAHGGTGLTSYTKGDILYTSADGVVSVLPIDTAGTRVLSNEGSDDFHVPEWINFSSTDSLLAPQQIDRISGWAIGSGDSSQTSPQLAQLVLSNGLTVTGNSGADSTLYGSLSYAENTTASPANIRNPFGWVNSTFWTRVEYLPLIILTWKPNTTGPLSDTRFWFGLHSPTLVATLVTANDDQHLEKGIGARCSFIAGDTGWRTWTADGTNQVLGTNGGIHSLTANYPQTIELEVTSSSTYRIRVNNSDWVTEAIPAALIGLNLCLMLSANTTLSAGGGQSRRIDIYSLYEETN